MEKVTQNIKIEMESFKENRQNKNHKCENCDCKITSKTGFSNQSLTNHKEKVNSELPNFGFGNSKSTFCREAHVHQLFRFC